MRLRRLLQDSGVRTVAVVVAYVAVALVALAVVVVAALSPEQRDDLASALRGQLATLVLGGVVALAGLTVLLLKGPGSYPSAARRLTADVRLLLDANVDHRLTPAGPPEVAELARAVNDLAERHARSEREVAARVAAARADLERERNRLAALMADLDVAVLVCSPGGRIQLYNSAARALLGDDPALGLGRSVFALVERELVAHALDRLAGGAPAARVATALPDGRLLQVRLSAAGGDHDDGGFVVVLDRADGGIDGPALHADIPADDLLQSLRRELVRDADLHVEVLDPQSACWVRADTFALATAVRHVVVRLARSCGARSLTLALTGEGRLEISCAAGASVQDEELQSWLAEPLRLGTAGSAADVFDQHGGPLAAASEGGRTTLRLALPLASPVHVPRPLDSSPVSRPEFYDFDLFDAPELSAAWQERPLDQLAYTVLDTETTGFLPEQGDRVVAVGAVHVVGGRVRPHEVFERLVDPRRPVPEAAVAVHGITDEMVRGQPPMEQVLPELARFADDRVVVGHNVAFDLGFLRLHEERAGVRLDQPVLDTLLLDAALHPDHADHSLDAVAARLGVDVTGRHTALGDALVTAEVLARLLVLLQARGIRTLGEALELSRDAYRARATARAPG